MNSLNTFNKKNGTSILLAAVVAFAPATVLAQHEGHQMAGYHAEMQSQMQKMNQSMTSMPMTNNPDLDFAMMMIPHHQGAIDMAKTQLKYGKDAKLRALAEEIIASQQKEIKVMQASIQEMQTTGSAMLDAKTTSSANATPLSSHSSHQ